MGNMENLVDFQIDIRMMNRQIDILEKKANEAFGLLLDELEEYYTNIKQVIFDVEAGEAKTAYYSLGNTLGTIFEDKNFIHNKDIGEKINNLGYSIYTGFILQYAVGYHAAKYLADESACIVQEPDLFISNGKDTAQKPDFFLAKFRELLDSKMPDKLVAIYQFGERIAKNKNFVQSLVIMDYIREIFPKPVIIVHLEDYQNKDSRSAYNEKCKQMIDIASSVPSSPSDLEA